MLPDPGSSRHRDVNEAARKGATCRSRLPTAVVKAARPSTVVRPVTPCSVMRARYSSVATAPTSPQNPQSSTVTRRSCRAAA